MKKILALSLTASCIALVACNKQEEKPAALIDSVAKKDTIVVVKKDTVVMAPKLDSIPAKKDTTLKASKAIVDSAKKTSTPKAPHRAVRTSGH